MTKSVIYLIAILAVAVLPAGCGEKEKTEEKKETAKPVIVKRVSRTDLVRTITLTGKVKPIEDSIISAEVGGNIVSKSASLGAYVEKNEELAKIDNKDYDKTYKQSEAMLLVADASLEQQQATQKQLEEDQKTNQRLYEQKVVSKKALDDINTSLAEVNALVKLSEAKVEEATISRDIAKRNKEKATIISPLEKAFVADVMFEVGSYVTPGTPLVRLVNIEEVWIEVGVGEKRINDVEKGMEAAKKSSRDKKAYVTFTVPTIVDKEYTGYIDQISPYANPASGAFTLRIRYKNVARELKGGMFAQVVLPVNTALDVIMVPRSAVSFEGNRNYVFVVEENRASKVEVLTGAIQNEEVEIVRGLTGNEIFVTDGIDILEDGDKVTVEKSIKDDLGSNLTVEKN